MYKMKEVCQKTGLTEKAVRFYVDQKLVFPKTESGLHYKSYRFDDDDIRLLQDIAALRSAEFTIGEIRQMLADPNAIPAIVAEKEGQLAAKIDAMQSAQKALQNLRIVERTDLSQVADAIEPRSTSRKETPKNTHNRPMWLLIYTLLLLLLGFVVTGGENLWLVCFVPAFLGGLEFPIMALGYFQYNHRYRKMPRKTVGNVISVITDEGITDYWEETNWEILHGMLHLGFLHWNWIRPDHWIPLIQFENEGEIITTAYRYGGLKHSWNPGATLEIAWEPGKEKQVYPCSDPVIRRKAWFYLLSGIFLLAIFFFAPKILSVIGV